MLRAANSLTAVSVSTVSRNSSWMRTRAAAALAVLAVGSSSSAGSVCGNVATICSNDAPIAPATAAADTTPWVPSGEASAARNSGMEPSLGNRNSAIGFACLQTPTRATIGLGALIGSRSGQFVVVLVLVELSLYGFTATTASASLAGRCREVTVIHSPGFTLLIAARPASGTLTRSVTYWLVASGDTSSAGITSVSAILRFASGGRNCRTASL